MCSPHPRGLSLDEGGGQAAHIVFPASAGMIPVALRCLGYDDSVPRIRGDDPLYSKSGASVAVCSPHPRG